LTTIACLLGIACATVDWRALSGHGAAARVPAIAAVAAVVDAPARALPVDGPTPIDLYRFALNALLVPLLDDSDPLRWTAGRARRCWWTARRSCPVRRCRPRISRSGG
jgi:hypothetical protein